MSHVDFKIFTEIASRLLDLFFREQKIFFQWNNNESV